MTREDLCDFPVSIVSRGKAKTIELPGDRFIFTSPGLRITVTNLEDTSQQVTLVATGAFHDTVLENGDVLTVSTGRSVLIHIVPGVNLAFVTGRFTFGFDADGNPIQPFEGNGQVIDICALLE